MTARNAAPKRVGIASAIPRPRSASGEPSVGPRQPEPHLAPAERAGPDDDERHHPERHPGRDQDRGEDGGRPLGQDAERAEAEADDERQEEGGDEDGDRRWAGVRRAVSAALERLGAGGRDKAQPDRGKPDDEGDGGAGTSSRGDGHEDRTEARDAETPGHEVEAGGRASVELEDAAPRSRRAARLEGGVRDDVGAAARRAAATSDGGASGAW